MLTHAEHRLEKSSKEFEKEVEKTWKDYEKAVEDAQTEFRSQAPFGADGIDNVKAKKGTHEFRQKVASLKEREEGMQFGIKLFNMPAYTPAAIGNIEKDLELLDEVWELKIRWDEQWDKWRNTRFYDLNVEVMKDIGEEFIDRLKDLEKDIKNWGVWSHMMGNLNVFVNTMPLIKKLGHRAIKPRHWDEVRGEIKQIFDEQSDNFTMDTLFSLKLHQNSDFIADLFERANSELVIDENIQEIERVWNSLEMEVVPYKEVNLKLRSTDVLF